MSFMADYGDDHDDYSWTREAKQRWTFLLVVIIVVAGVKTLFF